MGASRLTSQSLRTATTHPAWSAAALGRAAVLALHDELALAPKPGLVSFVDSGSHDDMDARTFMRSLLALRGYFVAISELGATCAPFAQLERCGIEAEARMRAATGGVNTHRGAIFMLGLLCAAAAAAQADGTPLDATSIQTALLRHWSDALTLRCARASSLPGGQAAARHGLRGASQEAALGMPTLMEVTLPAWRQARVLGLSTRAVQLHAFFATLAVMDDCNLVHRGGLDGLQFARAQATEFMQRGGAAAPDALDRARQLHHAFVARRLSPGGCADTLSAACFLDRIGAIV